MKIDIDVMKPYRIKEIDMNISEIDPYGEEDWEDENIWGGKKFEMKKGFVIPDKMWFFYFRKFKYIKGFSMRIFGINIKIIENNAIEKLNKNWSSGATG